MDMCGFPKTAFWLHRAQWVDDRPLIDIVPHWNWPGREGQPVTVMVLTNVERVQLHPQRQAGGRAGGRPVRDATLAIALCPGPARGGRVSRWAGGRTRGGRDHRTGCGVAPDAGSHAAGRRRRGRRSRSRSTRSTPKAGMSLPRTCRSPSPRRAARSSGSAMAIPTATSPRRAASAPCSTGWHS